MIRQRSFIRYSYWFCSAPKRNFLTEIAFFCGQSLEKKKIGPRVEEDRKSIKFVYCSPSLGLTSEFSYYSTHGNQLESKPIVWWSREISLGRVFTSSVCPLCLVIAANVEPRETSLYEVKILLIWSYDIFYSLYLILQHAFINLSSRKIRSYRGCPAWPPNITV